MTANAMQGDREMCLEAGMDDYVTKPFGVRELIARVKSNLRRTTMELDQNKKTQIFSTFFENNK